MTILFGAATWHNDPNLSPTSPTRFKITSAEVTARQPGLQREFIRPPSLAKSPYGEPPTASTPKIRDQPEKALNLIQSPPYGNSASTGISLVPPARQATRGSTNDKQHTPHLVEATTGSARTKNPNEIRPGQPHPAANPAVELLHRACGSPLQ
jgi:hypothetical protein